MSIDITYYPGGYIAAAPQQNRAVQIDSTAGTYTAWDQAGNVTASRALTAAELTRAAAQDAATAAASNQSTLQSRAQAALTANANFLALATPTNAQVVAFAQTTAKELNALIRLALQQLDSTSGT